jgi:hypothetical protein
MDCAVLKTHGALWLLAVAVSDKTWVIQGLAPPWCALGRTAMRSPTLRGRSLRLGLASLVGAGLGGAVPTIFQRLGLGEVAPSSPHFHLAKTSLKTVVSDFPFPNSLWPSGVSFFLSGLALWLLARHAPFWPRAALFFGVQMGATFLGPLFGRSGVTLASVDEGGQPRSWITNRDMFKKMPLPRQGESILVLTQGLRLAPIRHEWGEPSIVAECPDVGTVHVYPNLRPLPMEGGPE